MKKAKKILALLLCAVLLVGASVAGTVAYLTSQAEVTNTFTVGQVAITLDESKVDVYGAKDGDTRVTSNTYKLIPGHAYTKDPVIHVTAGSEPCYVFVKIENGISAIEATGNTTIAAQMNNNGWKVLNSGIYYKETAVDARTEAKNVDVFGNFTIATNADVSEYTNETIVVTAYAVQADGFTSAADAWAASFDNSL